MSQTRANVPVNGAPSPDSNERTIDDLVMYQAAQSTLDFNRGDGAAQTCANRLSKMHDRTYPTEVRDATALIATCCMARCRNPDDRRVFQDTLDRFDRTPNLAPAAVAQSLKNHLDSLKDDPVAFQNTLRFSSAFHLATDLIEPLPEPGHEEPFLEEMLQLSAGHLASCDRLATVPKAEPVISRVLYTPGGVLRPQWRSVQSIDPYGAEVLQGLRQRVPTVPTRWRRYLPYAAPTALVVLLIATIGLSLSALAGSRRDARLADSPASTSLTPPSVTISAGKKVLVVVATSLVGPGAIELTHRIDALALASGRQPGDPDGKENGRAEPPRQNIVIEYGATPAAAIVRPADLNVPKASSLIVRLHQAKLLGGAEYVLLARQLGDASTRIPLAVELIELPADEPAKTQGNSPDQAVAPTPSTLWSGLWEVPLSTRAETESGTARTAHLANQMALGDPTGAALAAEAALASEKPTAEDCVRAASVYLLLGGTPAHRSRAHDVLRAAYARFPQDERIIRLLFAVETETHRRVIQVHRAKELSNNRELERFQSASTDEHREAILRSWVIGFLQGGPSDMAYDPSSPLPFWADPSLEDVQACHGLAFTIPIIPPTPRLPFPGKSAFSWVEALNNTAKNNVSIIKQGIKAAEVFEGAGELFEAGDIAGGRWKITEGSVRLGFFTKAYAVKAAIAVAKPLVKDERDLQALTKADAAASIVTSCGGAVIATIGAWGSFGILGIAAVLQGIGCIKSVVDYVTLDDRGTTYFDREARTFGMSLEAASFVGSVLTPARVEC